MRRGKQDIEQRYAAAIRQTLAEINRDRKQRPQPFAIEECFVFDLPPYDFGDDRTEPAPVHSYSDFKEEWEVLSRQRR